MKSTFSANLYFSVSKLAGRDVKSALDELMLSEQLTRAELDALQWQRLENIIRTAYDNTPFYRKRFDEIGVSPDDIQCPADLRKIPPTNRDELRTNYASFVNKEYRGRTVKYGSSGSTGQPVILSQSTDALASFFAAKLRGHAWHGLPPGVREGKVWGSPMRGMRKWLMPLRNLATNRTLLSAFHATEEDMINVYRRMVGTKVRYIYGYSSSIYDFSKVLASRDVDSSELRPEVIITTSDVLLDDQKAFLMDYWCCPVIREYGAGETGIIGFECPEGKMHLTSENVYVEAMADRERAGEILVTPLINHAMPLLRYRLNDIAQLSYDTCPCGRSSPLIDNIQGRDSDILRMPDGRHLHSVALCYVNWALTDSGQDVLYFQLRQEALASFSLLVVPGPSGKTDPFINGVKQLLGDVTCRAIVVDKIPKTSSGKIRYTVSMVSESEGTHA